MQIIKLTVRKVCHLQRFHIFFLILIFLSLIGFQYWITFNKNNIYDDFVISDEYLIWNSKCRMLSKNPFDSSITKFINKEKYENCSNLPLLTAIIEDENGQNILILKRNEREIFKNINCCWSRVERPIPHEPKPQKNIDSSVTVKNCTAFNNSAILPKDTEIILVTCQNDDNKRDLKNRENTPIYQNVHSIINVEKVSNRSKLKNNGNATDRARKLSVLLIGLDNVSRLNFYRNLPKTVGYLDEKGWLLMKGYNKMGENTFPNLMALLTGQGEKEAAENCKPTVPFGLDNCPMMWYNFRNAGYVTAYAEDEADWSTFNWLKTGFVHPPTDYYLRPYIVATEKLLKTRRRFVNYYCTGPELATERILNSAVDFAVKFQNTPYFGFFWTNAVTHNSLSSLSILDPGILSRLQHLEREGVMNDSMIIFLSDHGIRFGEFRKTFMGWYEERLPFFYIWLPKWFRDENPEAYRSLTANQNRLTSPFDLYETLRDILMRADGDAASSTGCSKCQSLFKTVPDERGCEDAGISSHWCVCSVFEKNSSPSSEIVTQGAKKIVEHIENIVENYKNNLGERLCSKLNLDKIIRFYKVLSTDNKNSSAEYYYMVQLAPGGAKFEATVHYYGSGNYSINAEEINRIDSYKESAKCLHHGEKRFCQCI
ncbi:uncharacterized protein LOC122499454 [Leptopilina heterotoma]|uniref:uncharacterized protein LOC122499454 n=1 Tax=Leptopilina heterotoma TaxID=63436 RepID=UPI001CA7E915|nr:uncharacterized protein LOC122499454 [Leptopilina heterotoma]